MIRITFLVLALLGVQALLPRTAAASSISFGVSIKNYDRARADHLESRLKRWKAALARFKRMKQDDPAREPLRQELLRTRDQARAADALLKKTIYITLVNVAPEDFLYEKFIAELRTNKALQQADKLVGRADNGTYSGSLPKRFIRLRSEGELTPGGDPDVTPKSAARSTPTTSRPPSKPLPADLASGITARAPTKPTSAQQAAAKQAAARQAAAARAAAAKAAAAKAAGAKARARTSSSGGSGSSSDDTTPLMGQGR